MTADRRVHEKGFWRDLLCLFTPDPDIFWITAVYDKMTPKSLEIEIQTAVIVNINHLVLS